MHEMFDFKNKSVIVTGGARGIGHAIVQAFAEAGAKVVIADLRCEETKMNRDGCVIPVQTDVTKRDQVIRLRDVALREFGSIDVLVNCAGWDRLQPFIKTTPDLWEKILSINFLGVANTCHAILPAMIERKSGAIINISSDTGRVGSFGEAIYASSKAAIMAFSKTLAREHARDTALFTATSEAWNHSLLWRSLTPSRKRPEGELSCAAPPDLRD